MFSNKTLNEFDAEVAYALEQEKKRQEDSIELIASENYVSPLVLELQGSIFTNKYAEGYPKKRYYDGCSNCDLVEDLARKRACQLFDCDYANVQPHSGSQANNAVYHALLQPGDTVLGMDLDAGGHLTHGSKVNFSGKTYTSYCYGVNEEGKIDYDQVEALALEVKPKLLVAGFSAYSGIVDWKRMREIADKVGAYLFCDIAHIAGLVATGLYPSPLNYAHVVTTTTHKTLAGPRGGMILSKGQSAEFYKKLDLAIFPGTQGGPLVHIIAAKAVAFKEALEPSFRDYQEKVLLNAKAMVEVIKQRGYKVVSGGTDNHLFLIDLRDRNFTGKEASTLLESIHITANKNSVPGDHRSPFHTSGVRIGTPAITRRGFTEDDSRILANLICDTFDIVEDKEAQAQRLPIIKEQVLALCHKYPIYKNLKSA